MRTDCPSRGQLRGSGAGNAAGIGAGHCLLVGNLGRERAHRAPSLKRADVQRGFVRLWKAYAQTPNFHRMARNMLLAFLSWPLNDRLGMGDVASRHDDHQHRARKHDDGSGNRSHSVRCV